MKRGKPKGTTKVDSVLLDVGRCKQCGSTDRTKYTHTNIQRYTAYRCNKCKFFGQKDKPCPCGRGTYSERFTHIIKRRCRCQNCQQSRVEVSYENREESCLTT